MNAIVRVYRRYRLDLFEMFDYSIDETLLKAGCEPLRTDDGDTIYLRLSSCISSAACIT